MLKANIPLYISVQLGRRDYLEEYIISDEIWLPLPATKKQFLTAAEYVCSSWDNLEIKWYNTTIPYLFISNCLMKTPLAMVNHLAAQLNKLEDEQILKLTAIMSSCQRFDTVEEIIDYTYNPNRYTLIPNVFTHGEVGRMRISELDISGAASALKQYIDPDIFGVDTVIKENGWFTPLGYMTAKNAKCDTIAKRRVPAPLDLKGENGRDLFGRLCFDELQ